MNRIHKFENNRGESCFTEWMRTKGCGIAAVCCVAREENDADLYAYAYVHAILTFFRQYDCEKIIGLKRGRIAQLILDSCKYAAQRLDNVLDIPNSKHRIPYIAGFFTAADSRLVTFCAGNAAVSVDIGKSKRIFSSSSLRRLLGDRFRLTGTPLEAHSVKLKIWDNISDVEKLTLFWAQNTDKEQCPALAVDLKRQIGTTQILPYRAVITGRKHSGKCKSCQDFCDFKAFENGDFSAAVSDGAGGGSYSEYGAIMNVNAFLACSAQAKSSEQLAHDVLKRVKQNHDILQCGKPSGAIEDYATLMGVHVRDGIITYVHIGDGAIFARRTDGTTECISDADNGSAYNRTFFTIEPNASEHTYTGTADAKHYDMLLLMTDGVYNSYDAKERLEFVTDLFSAADAPNFDEMKLAELIDNDKVNKWGDDHSAILIDLRRDNK